MTSQREEINVRRIADVLGVVGAVTALNLIGFVAADGQQAALGEVAIEATAADTAAPAAVVGDMRAAGDSTAVGVSTAAGESTAVGDSGAAQDLPFTMNINSRVQVRFAYTDPDEGPDSGSFGIRRGRLALSGDAYEHFRYAVQMELAGNTVRLIDANVRYQIAPMATLWFGQGKAGFGRQQLNSSGNLHFVDRAITDGRFAPGRQQGVALLGQTEARTFEYSVGLYNGNGINSANDNSKFLTVGRVVWTPLGAYSPAESAHDYPSSPRIALGAAGLHNTLGKGDEEIEIVRVGAEAAFKVHGLNAVSEFYRERATPAAGARAFTNGWYVQAGYLLPDRRHELAARYAVISPDSPENIDTVEVGAAYSLYFNGHRAKVQADVRNIERKVTGTSDLEARVQYQITL